MVAVPVDQFGNGNDLIALPLQIGDQRIQSLRREFRPVVAEDDGAAAQMLMIADGGDDGIRAVILPVQGIHVPLNGIVAAFGGGADHIVVIIPVGRAEQEHVIARQLLHLPVDGYDFLALFIVGDLTHVFVVFAVVSQIMPGRQDGLHVLRIGIHPAARHEEGDMYVVPGKDIQDLSRVFVPPGSVEGEGHFFFLRIHAVDGQLPAVDGAGYGNRVGNEGGDAPDEGNDAEEEQDGPDDLRPDDGLPVFHFTEPLYPALYEMDKIFPHDL